MSASQKIMGHVYAIFTILVWGSCFVLTKQMLTAYTAIQIIPLRMGLAYLPLWVLRPKTLKLPWKDELMFILIGITGGSFYFLPAKHRPDLHLRRQRQHHRGPLPYPDGDPGPALLPQR